MADYPFNYSGATKRSTSAPYHVQRTPRGSVVICTAHVVTEEIKDEEARALALALNNEFHRRGQA